MKTQKWTSTLLLALWSVITLTSCMGVATPGSGTGDAAPSSDAATDPNGGAEADAGTDPNASAPPPAPAPVSPQSPEAPEPGPREYQTAVLLFQGNGTWSTEVASLKSILGSHGVRYHAVSSADLNEMSLDELSTYGLMIFPGGSGGTQAGSLSAETKMRVREAVQARGVGWLGFCAGAFIAVAPPPPPGGNPSYGLGIVAGPYLDYYALEDYFVRNGGTDIAMTRHMFADGSARDIVWYGGPMTPDVPGGVVARYPDGTPAISEMWSGEGFVILVGTHPTAPQAVRDSFGLEDADGLDYDVTWQLIESALNRQPLPAFR